MKRITLILLSLLLLGGCTSTNTAVAPSTEPTTTPETTTETNVATGCGVTSVCDTSEEDMSAYEGIVKGSMFYHMTLAESVEAINNKDSIIIFYGFSTCPWCVEVAPILSEIMVKYNQPVYYVNVRPEGTEKENDIRTDDNPDYVALQEYFKDITGPYDGKITVPLVVCIKDGEIQSYHFDTVEGHDAHERKMTEDEVKEVTDTFDKMIDEFVKSNS